MNARIKFSKVWFAMAFGAALAVGAGLVLHSFKAGSGLVHQSYSFLLVARGDVAAREAVMVYLDEVSHLKLGQSLHAAWDRVLHARLIDRLTAAGAKAVVFDIVFSDPMTNHPTADERLAQAVKNSGRVILAVDVVPIGERSKQAVPPIPALLAVAAGIGSAEVIPDSDMVVRQHTIERDLDLPTLSWAAAEFLEVPAAKQEALQHTPRWINYYAQPNMLPWVSYYQALEPALVDDDFFRGKVVFVGARVMTKMAGDRKDEYVNPFSFWVTDAMVQRGAARFISGVEIQATAFLNLLRGDWLRRLPPGTERLLLILLGVLFGAGLARLQSVWARAAAAAGLGVVVAAVYLGFARKFVWFPWLIVAAQAGLALFWSILFNAVQLYVQKRLYEYTLGLYLSPKLVQKFSGDPKFLRPGAEEQTLTILFSDIADFTSISQQMSSDALAKLMNQYFHGAVSRCIHHTDGTVVKYIGDAIFAFWNAPEPQGDHAFRACEAALRLRAQKIQYADGRLLRTRIGIHTGAAHVGNFGSPERVDYTALGESINLASRLEGLNKFLGTECLLTAATRQGLGDRLVTRALGEFQLKGFEKPVAVFELVGWPHEAAASAPWREAFEQALNNYHSRNLEFAGAGFRQVLELRPDDGPAKFYLARLEQLQAEILPDEWATHTIIKEK